MFNLKRSGVRRKPFRRELRVGNRSICSVVRRIFRKSFSADIRTLQVLVFLSDVTSNIYYDKIPATTIIGGCRFAT